MHLHNARSDAPLPAVAPLGGNGRYVEQMIEDPAGQMQKLSINRGESPLSWLKARGMLSERLFLAGERLREDWERAGLSPHVTMNWDGMACPSSGQKSRGANAASAPVIGHLSAKNRFHEAIRYSGPGLADILWRVACAGEGLSAAERALGWPARAGKLVLGFALERVAEYYRIA